MAPGSHDDSASSGIVVRPALEEDIAELASMVDEFVKGHLAENHRRSLDVLRAAYFGREPVAEIVVAERRGRVVAMGQWMRIHDMFWGMFGGRADWLYVKPEARGLGISAAILAMICERVRLAGGEFLYGQGNDNTKTLYARSAVAGPEYVDFHLGGEAFQEIADLSGLEPRQVVQGLPQPELNRVPARRRGD